MNIKIWDNHNQQWLEPMAIFFGRDNTVWKVTARKIGEDPLSDGWYDLQGDDLKKIAIVGDFNWNVDLLPSVGQGEQCAHNSTDIRTLRCNCCNDCGEILEMID